MKLFEERKQVQLDLIIDPLFQGLEHVCKRYLFALDLKRHLLFVADDDLLENRQQIEDRRADLGVVVVRFDRAAFENGLFDGRTLIKHLSGRLEFLVFKKLIYEFLSRIFKLFFIRRRQRIARQQHSRLDLDQRRRHHDKVSRDRDVETFHQPDVFDVFVSDLCDRDVEDIRLLLLDQIQKQIKRPGKLAELDLQLVARFGNDLGLFFIEVENELF